jgi:hypothetical protein
VAIKNQERRGGNGDREAECWDSGRGCRHGSSGQGREGGLRVSELAEGRNFRGNFRGKDVSFRGKDFSSGSKMASTCIDKFLAQRLFVRSKGK